MTTARNVEVSSAHFNLHAVPHTDMMIFGAGRNKPKRAHAAAIKRLAASFGAGFVQFVDDAGAHVHCFVVHHAIAAKIDGYAGEVLIELSNHGLLEPNGFDCTA